MNVEFGKRYLRADGGITGVLQPYNNMDYPFCDGDGGNTYTEGGNIYIGCSIDNLDLIAEVPEFMIEKLIKDVLEYNGVKQ